MLEIKFKFRTDQGKIKEEVSSDETRYLIKAANHYL
jgi:hypothetical protein